MGRGLGGWKGVGPFSFGLFFFSPLPCGLRKKAFGVTNMGMFCRWPSKDDLSRRLKRGDWSSFEERRKSGGVYRNTRHYGQVTTLPKMGRRRVAACRRWGLSICAFILHGKHGGDRVLVIIMECPFYIRVIFTEGGGHLPLPTYLLTWLVKVFCLERLSPGWYEASLSTLHALDT